MFYRETGEHFNFTTYSAEKMNNIIEKKEMGEFVADLRSIMGEFIPKELQLEEMSLRAYGKIQTCDRCMVSSVICGLIWLILGLLVLIFGLVFKKVDFLNFVLLGVGLMLSACLVKILVIMFGYLCKQSYLKKTNEEKTMSFNR